MLTTTFGHAGPQEAVAHDLWSAWHLDPMLLLGLVLTAYLYQRGHSKGGRRRPGSAWRVRSFWAGVIGLAVALVSPLDALSRMLASAHMVQHVVLILWAAPLLAVSRPFETIMRGLPVGAQRAAHTWRRRLGRSTNEWRVLRRPSVAWLLHAGTLWFWHASGPYDAAVAHQHVHVVEHASLLLTGSLFWSVVTRSRGAVRLSYGYGVLLVFTMAMQSVILSALLTFARSLWYQSYVTTSGHWDVEPLADQQLAGAIMWVPGGAVYLTAGLILAAAWLREAGAAEDELVRSAS